jgi:hypothetical protein
MVFQRFATHHFSTEKYQVMIGPLSL